MPFPTDTVPVCSFDGCGRSNYAHRLCSTHYKQRIRGRELTPIVSNIPPKDVVVPEGHCWCRRCERVLPRSGFMARNTHPGGRVSVCRDCVKAECPTRPKRSRPVDVVIPNGHKWCANCGTVKPTDGFHQRSNYCKPCHLDSNRRALYGMGRGEYDLLYQSQGGKCAICKRPCRRSRGKVLCVDHDHRTGEVRGLLCSLCNTAIGAFGDDPALLRSAINYLEGRAV